MNTFYDNSFKKKIVTIHPGEFYVSDKDELISTVLGSCVAVVLFDSVNMIGGMNHFMLPRRSLSDAKDIIKEPITRFGDHAIRALIKEMVKQGAEKSNLKAKIFGGSNVFNLEESNTKKNVGDSNVVFAHEYLEWLRIPVVAEDCGGLNSRKIYFSPTTFKVLMKRIQG